MGLGNSAFAETGKPSLEDAEKYVARADFENAAHTYGAFAKQHMQDPRAPWASAEAAMLNTRLGHYDVAAAESSLQQFENKFGSAHVESWSEMAFTMVDGFANRRDRANALIVLNRILAVQTKWLLEAEKKRSADVQRLREIEIRARARLAHEYTRAGDHAGAGVEYGRVSEIASKLGVWPGKIAPRATANHPETMDFIAEAFFYAAEQKRFEAERLPLPAYLGKGERDSVMAFVNGQGEQWHKQRKYLVEETNRLYAFVLGLELPKPEPPKPPPPPAPAGTIGLLGGDPNAPRAPFDTEWLSPVDPLAGPPSPQWAIAAAERVGKLWNDFGRENARMPIPSEWRGMGLVPGTDLRYEELRGEYRSGLAESPYEIAKQQARSAYRYCLDLSIQYRIVNEHTAACIHWLSRNYGAEYHEVDEFTPPGEFVLLGHYARPAPLPQFTH